MKHLQRVFMESVSIFERQPVLVLVRPSGIIWSLKDGTGDCEAGLEFSEFPILETQCFRRAPLSPKHINLIYETIASTAAYGSIPP